MNPHKILIAFCCISFICTHSFEIAPPFNTYAPSLTPRPTPRTSPAPDCPCCARLTKRLERLEASFALVCSALLHSDDLAFLEHESCKLGRVYLPDNLSNSRNPRLLRRELRRICLTRGIRTHAPPANWQHNYTQDAP